MQPHSLPASLDFPRIKLLTLGDPGVGKSCFIKRYCEGRFVAKYIPTIGIDYGVKKVDVNVSTLNQHQQSTQMPATAASASPAAVRINFWDVAGGPESLEIRNEFYNPAQGIILMYDTRSAQSFASLDTWWAEVCGYLTVLSPGPGSPTGNKFASTTSATPAGKVVGDTQGKPPVCILCAAKVDDVGEGRRVVGEEQGRQWANAHGFVGYFETSASSGVGVNEAMEAIMYRVVARFM